MWGHVGGTLSKNTDQKGSKMGKKIAKTIAKQAEKVQEIFAKETVTKEEQLGIGGTIGTALGLVRKHLAERRSGVLMDAENFVSGGRITGAKAEKIVKRALKKGIEKIAKEGSGPNRKEGT